jgi:hypothetical protein
MLGPISDFSGKTLRKNAQDPVIKEKFWAVAQTKGNIPLFRSLVATL